MSGPPASRPPYASMLIALDDSPRAAAVFEAGTALARLTGAQVFLVRVLTEPTDIPPAALTTPDNLGRDLERAVRGEFQRLMNTAPDVPFAAPLVVEGDPWRRIIDIGKQLDVDVIVMGSHRTHGIERVLGTVASRVVNHADRSVLVVREPPRS
ncbi:MAG TPA: universal stress protein [Polyangia bacterium]|nr:universal stress protein [Polyangia bacterium]